MKTARLNLFIPADLKEWLIKQAEKDARSLNNYILIVLKNHKAEVEGRS